jgi:hypothetical protein
MEEGGDPVWMLNQEFPRSSADRPRDRAGRPRNACLGTLENCRGSKKNLQIRTPGENVTDVRIHPKASIDSMVNQVPPWKSGPRSV